MACERVRGINHCGLANDFVTRGVPDSPYAMVVVPVGLVYGGRVDVSTT